MSVPPPGSSWFDDLRCSASRSSVGRAARRWSTLSVERHQREPVAVLQALDHRGQALLDLVEAPVARHRAGAIDHRDHVERQPVILRRVDVRGDRELQRRLVLAGQPVLPDRQPGRQAQGRRAAGRQRREVLVEEAVGVERVGPGEAALVEDLRNSPMSCWPPKLTPPPPVSPLLALFEAPLHAARRAMHQSLRMPGAGAGAVPRASRRDRSGHARARFAAPSRNRDSDVRAGTRDRARS